MDLDRRTNRCAICEIMTMTGGVLIWVPYGESLGFSF